jgi:hypothetical protein
MSKDDSFFMVIFVLNFSDAKLGKKIIGGMWKDGYLEEWMDGWMEEWIDG